MSKRKTALIIGMGEFGFHTAKHLSVEVCEVIAIDIVEKRVNAIKNFVIKAIVADAAQERTLDQVISKDIDFVVLCIGNIEKSMITTLYLKEFGYENVFIKAVTDEHERILKMLGVQNIIFPEKDMAHRLSTRLVNKNMLDYIPLSDEYSISEVTPLEKLGGQTLNDSNFMHKYKLTIIAIQRPDKSKLIFTPEPSYTIGKQDTYMVLDKKKDIINFKNLL